MRHAAPYLVMMLHVLPAAAQQPLETKLVIQQGGRETGREEFTLRQSRARGLPGTTIIHQAYCGEMSLDLLLAIGKPLKRNRPGPDRE